jgi:hypothetical protein
MASRSEGVKALRSSFSSCSPSAMLVTLTTRGCCSLTLLPTSPAGLTRRLFAEDRLGFHPDPWQTNGNDIDPVNPEMEVG